MKKIKLIEIKKKIHEEYAAGRDWCRLDKGHYYKMMINTDNGYIWADQFLTTNDWAEYQSKTIKSLNYLPGYVEETTLRTQSSYYNKQDGR